MARPLCRCSRECASPRQLLSLTRKTTASLEADEKKETEACIAPPCQIALGTLILTPASRSRASKPPWSQIAVSPEGKGLQGVELASLGQEGDAAGPADFTVQGAVWISSPKRQLGRPMQQRLLGKRGSLLNASFGCRLHFSLVHTRIHSLCIVQLGICC